MELNSFVDIVLDFTGYSPNKADQEICLQDHNYTNLNNHHNQSKSQNDIFQNHKRLWHKEKVRSGNKNDNIHYPTSDEDEIEQRSKKGEEVRKLHNTLEKKRRATQRSLMEGLRSCLPFGNNSKRRWSQHHIINSAISHIFRLSKEDFLIQQEIRELQKTESKMLLRLRQRPVQPRSASHLSTDSGGDSGILNSEDDELEVQVA